MTSGIFNTPEQIFDLYHIFVEVIFGSVLMSWIGICIIIVLMGALTRMSPLLISFIIGAFTVALGGVWGGAIVLMPMTILALIYFMYNMVNYFYQR